MNKTPKPADSAPEAYQATPIRLSDPGRCPRTSARNEPISARRPPTERTRPAAIPARNEPISPPAPARNKPDLTTIAGLDGPIPQGRAQDCSRVQSASYG